MQIHIDSVMQMAAALPGATEEVKFDNYIAYTVCKKIFVLLVPEEEPSVCMKVNPDFFGERTERTGVEQAPYFARGQWIRIYMPNDVHPKELEEWIQHSYEQVVAKLPKKEQAHLSQL